MKASLYNLLAFSSALIGVASISIPKRTAVTSNSFHFLLDSLSVAPTRFQLTATWHWATVVSPIGCLGTDYVCVVIPLQADNINTKAQLTAKIRSNGGSIPVNYTVINQSFY